MHERVGVLDTPLAGTGPAAPSGHRPSPRLIVRGAVASVVGAVACYAVLDSGVLPGLVALALALVLIVVIPTARRYPLRVALNGALALGWSPFLWWVPWPVRVDHGAVVVSIGLAVVLFLVLSSADPRARVRALFPRVRSVDVLPALSVVAAVVAMRAWAFASGPREALVVLLPGVDNVAHFQIFTTMRAYGAVLTQLPPAPGGGQWGFTGYPAGFHSMVATVAELLEPGSSAGPGTLALYAHSVAVVVVLGVLVLTAAIASLPRLDDRPWVCATVVTTTVMAFVWSPGQNLFFDGFATFWLGTLTGGVAIVLSLDPRRPWGVVRCVAVVGLLLTVSQTWAPLLLLSAPALLPFCVQLRRPRFGRGHRWVWLGGAVFAVLVVLALMRVYASLVQRADLRFLVTTTGGLTGTSPLPTFVLVLLAFYVCLVIGSRSGTAVPEERDRLLGRRVRVLVVVPVIALASGGALLAAQLSATGTTSYFFLKYLIGIELVLAAWVPAALGILLAARLPRAVRVPAFLPGTAAVLLASQVFAPFPWAAVADEAQPGGTASVGAPRSVDAMADGLVRAIDDASVATAFHREYVALGPERGAQGFYLDAWFHAAYATSSSSVAARQDLLRLKLDDAAAAAPTVRDVLAVDPTVEVVVPPEQVAPLRTALDDEALARRVISWDAGGPVG